MEEQEQGALEALRGGARLALITATLGWGAAAALRWVLPGELQWSPLTTWFATQDGLGGGVYLAVLAVGWLWATRSRWQPPTWGARATVAATLLPLALVPVQWLIFRGYVLSPDEASALLQVDLFFDGRWTEPVPEAWRRWGRAIEPLMIAFLDEGERWRSVYLPGNAGLLALYRAVGLGGTAHLLTASATVATIAWVARQVWPEERWAPAVAALLLATTPQFLGMSMTYWAMPMHLLVSIAWMGCFLRDDRVGYALALALGLLGLVVHQFHVHLLVAAPFLLDAWLRRRYGVVALFAAAYAGLVLAVLGSGLYGGGDAVIESQGFTAKVLGLLSARMGSDAVNWSTNLGLFQSWSNPAVVLLCWASLVSFPHTTRLTRLLWLGIAVHLLPYVLVMPSSFHGWGYRYLEPMLGHFVLIAVATLVWLRRQGAGALATRATFALTLGTAAVLLPMRAAQMAQEVAPRRAADAWLSGLDASVVLMDTEMMRVSGEFIRSDHGRRRPMRMVARILRDTHLRELCASHPDLVWVGPEHLERFGIPRLAPGLIGEHEPIGARLAEVGCPDRSAPLPPPTGW